LAPLQFFGVDNCDGGTGLRGGARKARCGNDDLAVRLGGDRGGGDRKSEQANAS
jgi:hypothetical protein